MIIWGISGNSHDAAIAVFKYSMRPAWMRLSNEMELVFASQSERFSGVKNDAHLNKELVNYAKQWGEPDELVWYEKPFIKTLRQYRAGQGWNYSKNNIKKYLQSYNINCPIRYSSHHRSHASAGYLTSGFDNATILCIDSIGEFETLTLWNANTTKQGEYKGVHSLAQVASQGYPNSVGLWYSAMTQRIGLKPQEDEYILMGMAAYGDPDRFYNDIYNDLIEFNGKIVKCKQNLHRGCLWWKPEYNSPQDILDIAAATQKVYTEIFESLLQMARLKTTSNNLVLMGGCALNCSANSIAYKYFDNVWIMPNPGDSGSAIGSVLSYYNKSIEWPGAYLGYNIEGEYPVEETIKELTHKQICGVASGRAEFGPRAFGNRSLLADPRGSNIKDRVNDIKHRQQFRPFAPVVLSEHFDDNFSGYANSYMQFTAQCRNPNLYPAIVHTDNTSRVQLVKPDGSGIRRLLERWYEETGCPMLLNTSLNIKGKPIVNNIADAKAFEKQYGVKVCT